MTETLNDKPLVAAVNDIKTKRRPSQTTCEHGVPYVHPTEYCPICLRQAMRSEGP